MEPVRAGGNSGGGREERAYLLRYRAAYYILV